MKNQYRHIENLPGLSNDDIAKHKNFKSILDKRTENIKRNKETRKRLFKVGLSAVIIGSITIGMIYWQNLPLQKPKINPIDLKNTENVISSKDFQKLEIPTAVPIEESEKSKEEIPKVKTEINKEKEKNDTDLDKKQSEITDKSGIQIGYEKAYPTVGMDSLSNYFNEKLKYPEKVDKKEGIEGTVNVVFTITKDGDASKIEINNSLGEPFDEECIRLISNMPRWEPAVRNGKTVDSKVSLQFSFQIKK
jgi:TonB family protein